MSERWELHKFWPVYERAQEAAYHTDDVMWQSTSILWGANTILLGFVLAAMHDRRALPLIIASVVGVVLTGFAARICAVAKVAKSVGYRICREIENHAEFPADLRLHTRIDKCYPKGFGRRWIYGVSMMFGLIWVFVFLYALSLCHLTSG